MLKVYTLIGIIPIESVVDEPQTKEMFMGILKNIFGKDKSPPKQSNEFKNTIPLEQKASKNNRLLVDNVSKPTSTTYTNAYKNADIVNACVSYSADIASQIKLKVMTDNNGELIPINDKKINDWVKQPNPFMSWATLFQLYFQSYLVTGNAYLTFEKVGIGYESWVLDPTKTEVVPDTRKYISGYIFDSQISYRASEVIFMKNGDITNGYYGLSPIASLIDMLSIEGYAVDDLKDFYSNSMIMQGLFTSEYQLNETQIESLRTQFRALYGKGGEDRFGHLFMGNNLKYQPMKVNVKDGMLLDALNISEDRIYKLFRINPILLGVGRSNSGDDIRLAKENYLNNFIRPLVNKLIGEFTTFFRRVLKNNNVEVICDYSNIPEITNAIQQKVDYVSKAQQNGILSVNESRDLLNLPKVSDKWANERFLPSFLLGTQPISLNGEQIDLSPTNQQVSPSNANVNGGGENDNLR